MSDEKDCYGQHHYFVAQSGVIEDEMKIFVIIVCTACGEGDVKEFKVSNIPYLLQKENQK